jgi:hypothetical protein
MRKDNFIYNDFVRITEKKQEKAQRKRKIGRKKVVPKRTKKKHTIKKRIKYM